MTKQELILKVSKATGLPTEDVRKSMDATFSEIKKSVKGGEGVFCRGFGSFTTKHRARKIARNIGQGTSMVVPEHRIAYFKPAPDFANGVR
jgi:DNA-binding protein HU-beta